MAIYHIQIRNPLSDRWAKLDTRTGRIVRYKRTPGPFKGVEVREPRGFAMETRIKAALQ